MGVGSAHAGIPTSREAKAGGSGVQGPSSRTTWTTQDYVSRREREKEEETTAPSARIEKSLSSHSAALVGGSPGNSVFQPAPQSPERTDLRGDRPSRTEPDKRSKQPAAGTSKTGRVDPNPCGIQLGAASARQGNQTSRTGRGGAHDRQRPSPREVGRGREKTGRGDDGAGRDRLKLGLQGF